MGVKLYDPAESILVIGARKITGFIEGTGIKIGRLEDLLTLHTGMDGEQAVTRNKNRSGFVDISLMASSAANDFLSAKFNEHELTGTGFFPMGFKDLRGTTKISGADCFVVKPPDTERAKELGDSVWRVIVPKMTGVFGGLIAA